MKNIKVNCAKCGGSFDYYWLKEGLCGGCRGNPKIIGKFEMTDEKKADLFLNYFNNFLTVERFAEYYGFSDSEAREVIDTGRMLHEKRVLENPPKPPAKSRGKLKENS